MKTIKTPILRKIELKYTERQIFLLLSLYNDKKFPRPKETFINDIDVLENSGLIRVPQNRAETLTITNKGLEELKGSFDGIIIKK